MFRLLDILICVSLPIFRQNNCFICLCIKAVFPQVKYFIFIINFGKYFFIYHDKEIVDRIKHIKCIFKTNWHQIPKNYNDISKSPPDRYS